MSEEGTKAAVLTALGAIDLGSDGIGLVESGRISTVTVDDSGEVRFDFSLEHGDPADLAARLRTTVSEVDGVSKVRMNVKLPTATPVQPAGNAAGKGRQGLQPGSVPAPTPKPGLLPTVDHVVAVSSGKGGVGKSMVAANLAAAMAAMGMSVGILDADIYGPNIPLMFGEVRRPKVHGPKGQEMMEPLEAHGVRLMSLGFLLREDQPAIMRGPLIAGILKQFMEQVEWGKLDVLVVDMPPGTGDAQLSLVQTVDLDGAILVTTPQKVAVGDVRRAIRMFERVNTRVLGVVENMSGLTLPNGERLDLFGAGGGSALAKEMDVPFLGEVPLDPAVRVAGDEGVPTVLSAPDSPAGVALLAVAKRLVEDLKITSRR